MSFPISLGSRCHLFSYRGLGGNEKRSVQQATICEKSTYTRNSHSTIFRGFSRGGKIDTFPPVAVIPLYIIPPDPVPASPEIAEKDEHLGFC